MRIWALASLLLAVLGWASYLPLAKNPAYRATLWPMWTALAVAAFLGIIALRKPEQANWFNRSLAILGLLISLLAIPAYLFMLKTPAAEGRPQVGQPLPAIRVKSEYQNDVLSSQSMVSNGPLLLVFFRGFW